MSRKRAIAVGTGDATPASLSVFESIARLCAAAGNNVPWTVVEAGEAWTFKPDAMPSEGVIVWGNTPTKARKLPGMLRWALRREMALLRLKSGQGSLTVRDVHRLAPARRSGGLRHRVRATLLSGLMVELASDDRYTRVIDEVAVAAGAARPGRVHLRPSRDGSAIARLTGIDGIPFELRVAAIGGRKDPNRNANALVALDAAAVPLVPRLFRRGHTAGAAWTSESVLAGHPAPRLTRSITVDVVELVAGLRRAVPATSLRDRMLWLAQRYPRWARLARQLADAHDERAPSVMQHGDLWIGNLLVRRGRLAGVVDWDTWHPAGLPGVDLVQLLAMQQRARTHQDIGQLWASGVWRSSEFLSASAPYWRAIGVAPDPTMLEAVGLDWWASQIVKRQTFAAIPGWVERNVDAVLETVSGAS